jgi:hypothetical protein
VSGEVAQDTGHEGDARCSCADKTPIPAYNGLLILAIIDVSTASLGSDNSVGSCFEQS